MSIKDDIKSYIIKSGLSMTDVANELNRRNGTNYSLANLSKKINNETIRYNDVLNIAEICGYKIEWKKENKSTD